jgi:hypothetical protein
MYWNKKMSLPEIGKKFGLSGHTIRYHMKCYGIPRRNFLDGINLKASKNRVSFKCEVCGKEFTVTKSDVVRRKRMGSKIKYCSATCRAVGMKGRWLKKSKDLINTVGITYRLRKSIRKCQICGFDVEPRILTLHHKDMNHSNNSPKNLLLVCPNCHSLEHIKAGKPPRPPILFFCHNHKTWKYKPKVCASCGQKFIPKSPARARSKFCYDCLPLSTNPNFKKIQWKLHSELRRKKRPKRKLPKKWCTIRACKKPVKNICVHGHFCDVHWKNHWIIQGPNAHNDKEILHLGELRK